MAKKHRQNVRIIQEPSAGDLKARIKELEQQKSTVRKLDDDEVRTVVRNDGQNPSIAPLVWLMLLMGLFYLAYLFGFSVRALTVWGVVVDWFYAAGDVLANWADALGDFFVDWWKQLTGLI